MGVISAIIALCKAVPVLERLFLDVADEIREQKAQNRLKAKLSFIDDAVANARAGMQEPSVQGAERNSRTDGASSISRCCKNSSRMDESGVEKSC